MTGATKDGRLKNEESESKRGRPEIFFKYDGTMEDLARALFARSPTPSAESTE